METEAVQTYYRQRDEWSRLDTAAGQFELMRCLRILEEHLVDERQVLDLGGGPGRYAIELARRGHRVTLVDLCEHHVEEARRRMDERGLLSRADRLCAGDACDLSAFDDDAFDAVVSFGPFYHLVDESARRCAASELARVTADGGLAFVQFVPPLSGFVRLVDRAVSDPGALTVSAFEEPAQEAPSPTSPVHGFQEASYIEADQLQGLFGEVGFETLDTLSVLGLAAGREEQLGSIQARDPELYEEFAALVEKTAREPAVIAMGQLALWVGRYRA